MAGRSYALNPKAMCVAYPRANNHIGDKQRCFLKDGMLSFCAQQAVLRDQRLLPPHQPINSLAMPKTAPPRISQGAPTSYLTTKNKAPAAIP